MTKPVPISYPFWAWLLIVVAFFGLNPMMAYLNWQATLAYTAAVYDDEIPALKRNNAKVDDYIAAYRAHTVALTAYETFESDFLTRYEKDATRLSFGLPSIDPGAPQTQVHYIDPNKVAP